MNNFEFVKKVSWFLEKTDPLKLILESILDHMSWRRFLNHTTDEMVEELISSLKKYPDISDPYKTTMVVERNDSKEIMFDYKPFHHLMTYVNVEDVLQKSNTKAEESDICSIEVWYGVPRPQLDDEQYLVNPDEEKCMYFIFCKEDDDSIQVNLMERYSYGPDSDGDICSFSKFVWGMCTNDEPPV